jgi:hypothetical protein
MPQSVEIAPPNSLILVVGSIRPEVPRSFERSIIASTSSCIAVGCRAQSDGPTCFLLGSDGEVKPRGAPAFTGKLQTPDHVVALETVEGARIAQQVVHSECVVIRVWVNDSFEPDQVMVSIAE